MPHRINRIRIMYLYESCERHNYHVMVETDEGFDKCVDGHRSGSLYTIVDGKQTGISREEARDRALMDADTWSQFLGIPVDPFIEDGVTHEPSMSLGTYDIQREMGEGRKAKKA